MGAAGTWTAPGRVNLIGEYTDLNEGHVLPLAIPQRTRVTVTLRPGRRLSMRSRQRAGEKAVEVDLGASGPQASGWTAYPLAVARALEDAGVRLGGADLLFDSDVPIGAGLSSSAALECSAALAFSDLAGAGLAPMELARIAQRAENDYVGVPCGIMDQAASMCCMEGSALLLDTRSLDFVQVPLDLDRAGLCLLVVDTGVKHEVGESAYAERRRSCEEAARLLGVKALRDVPAEAAEAALGRLEAVGGELLMRRARHVLSELQRVREVAALLGAGEPAAVGAVLVAGHASLRDDLEVSCPELDAVVDTAVAEGALGARMTGAGFGGSAVVLADRSGVDRLTAGIADAFARLGYRPPHSFVVTASSGARREA